MRAASAICLLAWAVGIGAALFGRWVLAPGLEQNLVLLDPNLLKSLMHPIHLRLAEVALACHLLLAGMSHLWLRWRWATTLGLCLVGVALLQRVVVVPELYAAYGRADLVASRPMQAILSANEFMLYDGLLTALSIVGLMVYLAVHVTRLGKGETDDTFAPVVPSTSA